jgi:hypothetical protein
VKVVFTPQKLEDEPLSPSDSEAWVYELGVESEQVVLLQGLFESYEGLATVRTVGFDPPRVNIICTKDTVNDVGDLLAWFHENGQL